MGASLDGAESRANVQIRAEASAYWWVFVVPGRRSRIAGVDDLVVRSHVRAKTLTAGVISWCPGRKSLTADEDDPVVEVLDRSGGSLSDGRRA